MPESRVLAEPLRGGRTTLGVVKLGETVRRPATPNSIFVRNLLRHLERSGFAGAPRHLGVDEDNRDVFSYLPGEVPSELGEHEDHVLQAAARLIRGFHDATAAMVDSDAASCSGLEVVCHNDLSPCNAVFRAGIPVALIDFDAACPGTRAFDLALRLKYAGIAAQDMQLIPTALLSSTNKRALPARAGKPGLRGSISGSTIVESPGSVPRGKRPYGLAYALDTALQQTPTGETLFVVPTYTGLLELHRELERRGLTPHYWEEKGP